MQTLSNPIISVTLVMWCKTLAALLLAHSCAAQWWNSAVYYRILVDSFKDSDGDGLGDIKVGFLLIHVGVTKQISYVKALGADAIILSPISARSTDCSKPGLVDFGDIDKRYGNLDQFNDLLEKAKKLEIKVVVTLPIQTVSMTSEWYNSSVEKVTGFEDRLLWKEGNQDDPPEPEANIIWSWNDVRGAYLGVSNKEALVNFCSDAVAAALATVQCAWLRRGAAGILLNPDFPKMQDCGEKLLKKIVSEAITCARAANLEMPAIVVESSLNAIEAARYYADGGIGANSVISNAMTSPTRSSAPEMTLAILATLLNAPQDMVPTWLTSAPSESRITTRYGADMVDAINLLTLMLPGAGIIQQGDELGVADTILEWASSDKCWPRAATPSSAPFPWDDTANGGFSSGEPWLPLTPNYRYANAKTEFANDFSHVAVTRIAAAMRKSPAMGPHFEVTRLNGAVAVLRWGSSGSLLAVANVAKDNTEIKISNIPGLPAEMTVAASSSGSGLSIGSHVATEKTLKLAPGEAALLAGPPRHCGGPGPVDKIANKLNEGWQKINKYFSV